MLVRAKDQGATDPNVGYRAIMVQSHASRTQGGGGGFV